MNTPERPAPATPVGWRRYMGIGLVVTGLVMVAGFGIFVVSILGTLEDQNARVIELEAGLLRNQTVLSVLGSEQAELVYMSGPGKTGHTGGRMLWDRDRRLGIIYLRGLDSLSSGGEYRLWSVAGGKPSSGILLLPAPSGTILEVLDRIPEPSGKGKEMFIVTAEPKGNSGAPAGTLVLAGSPAQ
ncbi:MAG: anti-sigma factor [Ignavibacteria bacterium]|nr:anti-sigma factor [Ignavibacteria bacterium]